MKRRNIIGNNLKLLRIKNGYSQEKLAATLNLLGLNMDRSALSRIESYNREVYDYELLYFAKALNVSVLDLYIDLKNDINK